MLHRFCVGIVMLFLTCVVVAPGVFAAGESANYFTAKEVWIAPTGVTAMKQSVTCKPTECDIDTTKASFIYVPQSVGVSALIGSIAAVQHGGTTAYATVVQIADLKNGALGVSHKLAMALGIAGAPTTSVPAAVAVMLLPNTKTQGSLPSDEMIKKIGAVELNKFGGESVLTDTSVPDSQKSIAIAPKSLEGSAVVSPADNGKQKDATAKQNGEGATDAAAYSSDTKDFAEYRPLIGGTLLPGVAQDLGVHRVLTGKDNENAAYNWLRIDVLKKFANLLIGWTAAIAVVAVIFGAYQYLTAVGDAEQIKSAHKTITFSLVGVAVALLAFAIVQVIVNLELSGEVNTESTAKESELAPAATANDFCSAAPVTASKSEFTANPQPICDIVTGVQQVAGCSGDLVQKKLREIAIPRTERKISYYDFAVEVLQASGKTYAPASGYDEATAGAYGIFRAAQCTGFLQTWNGKQNNFLKDLLLTAGLATLGQLFGQEAQDTRFTQNPPPPPPPRILTPICGNYFLEKGEECDSGPKGSISCGAKDAPNACKKIVGCGNGIVEQGEQCDAGPKGNAVCGAVGAANACRVITMCGNYKVEPGEECDSGLQGSNFCGAPSTPNACKKIVGCGNGIVEPGEQCDAGPTGNAACGAPQSANACQKIVNGGGTHPANVDYGTGTHYPRPEPTGPYAQPVKPVQPGIGPFVVTKKPAVTQPATTKKPGATDKTPRTIARQPAKPGKPDDGGRGSKNHISQDGSSGDGDSNGGTDDGVDDGDSANAEVDVGSDADGVGLVNPFGLLAADSLWGIDAPGTTQRPSLDTTGISLFDRPLLLLAALPGQVTPASNPRDKIIPCSGESGCSLEVGALPQSNFRDEFLPLIARFMVYAITSVAFVIFFVAGAMMVLSYGDQEMNKKAKNMIIWGIVGLCFAAAAYALVTGVLNIKFGTQEMSATSSTEQSAEGDGAAAQDESATEKPAETK